MSEMIALAASAPPAVVYPLYLQAIIAIVKGAVLLFVLLTLAAYAVFAERRILAFMQGRVGPNRAGPFGFLQPLADVFKLLTKEEANPPFADKWLYYAAPAIITITSMLTFAVIPFGPSDWFIITDLNVGLLFFLALSSLGVYSIVLAGWSSNSKYAALGGLRATAQMISYELPMSLALVGVVLAAGTFSLREIVCAQSGLWFIVIQPVGFSVFLIAAVAESRRTPFDLPEAENEIVAGFHTEYSSMKFALFFLGEYVSIMLLSCIIAVVYLGGWHGPWLPPPLWMLIKVGALVFFFIWIRATFPRLRYDHLMELGWKWLLPLAIANVVITAALLLAFPKLVQGAGK